MLQGLGAELQARSEGSWGNRLDATLRFDVRPFETERGANDAEARLLDAIEPPAGSLLRATLADGTFQQRWVLGVQTRPTATGSDRVAVLDAALPWPLNALEIVTGQLDIDDGDGRHERFAGLGLRAGHPRWARRRALRRVGADLARGGVGTG